VGAVEEELARLDTEVDAAGTPSLHEPVDRVRQRLAGLRGALQALEDGRHPADVTGQEA
jgi:hypothetical protein